MATLGPVAGVQHRDPGSPTRLFLERARRLAALCARTGAALFVNGRVDVALAVGSHVHLPVQGPRPSEVRSACPGRWISAAVHDRGELAGAEGADVVTISPVFSPGSKPGDTRAPLGTEGFERLARVTPAPAWALGGLTPSRVRTLRGAAGVVVQSALLEAEDPGATAHALLGAIDPG